MTSESIARRTSHAANGAHEEPFTHEIRDHAGDWLWRGDEGSMRLIFSNLSGASFMDRPSWSRLQYTDYMDWMRGFTADYWPGRDDPYRPGLFIELAVIAGQAIDSFRFDTQGCASQEQRRA